MEALILFLYKEGLKMYFKHQKSIALVLSFIVTYSFMIERISSKEKYETENYVQVTAHRGSSLKARDNSFEAIKLAIEEKADYIEVDARRTKDNKVVLSHDDNFIYDNGKSKSIFNSTLKELNEDKNSFLFGKENNIGTLEKTLKMVKGKAKLNIDIKINNDEEILPELIVKLIEKYNMEENTVITSNNYQAIMNVRKFNPAIKIGYITRELPENLNEIDILSIEYTALNKNMVEKVHKYKKQIFAWTINNEIEAEKAINLGVDNIITNDVRMVKTLLNKISSNVGGHLSFYQIFS